MRILPNRKYTRRLTAALCALTLLAGTCPGTVFADDAIEIDDGSDDLYEGSQGSLDLAEDFGLIVDEGNDVQVTQGVSMDTLQDAIDKGDTKLLNKIASLGALTGGSSGTQTGEGIDSGGAYRGMGEDDEDDVYSDLSLDEGDADEVSEDPEDETELNESPGRLTAANPDRIQIMLDDMSGMDSPTGSEGELTAAAYIENTMRGLGYTVQEQAFHEGVLNEDGVDAPGVNILAERGANSQKNRKQDIFLIVTHYDSKRSPSEDDPFANDKSGVVALMESARILSNVITDTDICFLFLSGQEDGGFGASSFIESLSDENRARITGVLAVERVGYDTDMPCVLKTLTGERNAVGDIVQQLGVTSEKLNAQRQAAEDAFDGGYLDVGESSDGFLDEQALAEIEADPEAAETETEPEEGFIEVPSAWSYLKDSTSAHGTFANASFTAVTVSQYTPDLDQPSYEETKALGLADDTAEELAQDRAEVVEQAVGRSDAEPADAIVVLEDSNLTGSSDEEEDGEWVEFEVDEMDSYDADFPIVDAYAIAQLTDVLSASLARVMDPKT